MVPLVLQARQSRQVPALYNLRTRMKNFLSRKLPDNMPQHTHFFKIKTIILLHISMMTGFFQQKNVDNLKLSNIIPCLHLSNGPIAQLAR
ncbi:MAG: hypothetical protein KAI75_09470, partial [Desulfobulbaceae bacterium]|nr:hypothetical protein [Desulfobulbaceae bacterium]